MIRKMMVFNPRMCMIIVVQLVILSVAKNLVCLANRFNKILRHAQNDKSI
jgi:hypothetical protein